MTPNDCWSPASSGVHFVPNRKSPIGTSPTNESVSRRSENTIARVVTIETRAAPKSAIRTPPSKRERAEGRRTREVRRPIAPSATENSAMGVRSGGRFGLLEVLLRGGQLLVGQRH